MNNVEIVKKVTHAFCENRLDQQVLRQYFAPTFKHVANGRQSDLKEYSKRLASYTEGYKSLEIPKWDELFAADDKVVASYTLEAETEAGKKEKLAIMAVWTLANGKVESLREVDAASES